MKICVETATAIRVMLVDGAHLQSPCHPRAQATDLSEVPLEIPALRPPRGTEAQRQGYDMRVGAFNLSVRLDTLVRADSVLAHYVAQLQHAGWRLSGTGVHTARVASQELSATDRNGHGWRGTLIAWFVDTSQHVQLSMQSVRE